ncbi:MAG: hypothetical protein ABSH09_23690 [Bryobacteraceae bacterium]
MKSVPLDSTPEFQHFTDVMRKVLDVSKEELDRRVQAAKDASPRKNNPNAPGQKRAKRSNGNRP